MKKLTSRQVLKSLGKNLDHLTNEIVGLKITLSPLGIRQLSERVANCEAATNRMCNRLDAIEILLQKALSLDHLRKMLYAEQDAREAGIKAREPFYDIAKDWKEPVAHA